jgi:predicted lipoprotein with Yx(FWY)xxD motif
LNRIHLSIAALALALALAAAGCGSSSDGGGGGAYGGGESATSTATTAEKKSEVGGPVSPSSISINNLGGDVGRVLVDAEGHTLYYFEKDKGGKSACYGACAKVWPPLLSEGPEEARGGVSAAKMGTTKRSDGTVQVTYAGWPLYTYEADKSPGEANGTDVKSFGATWYPLHPNGEKAGE